MNSQEAVDTVFKILDEQFKLKGIEYAGDMADRWRNFTQGAHLQSETKEQTLLGYVDKQVVSLFDAKHHNTALLTDRAFVLEKAGDIAVYMIILMAMSLEQPPMELKNVS